MNSKKILSLVLAGAMTMSSFTAAFAAPADVKDADQVKAVDALMALNIVNGYEDGTFKPENTVTRAEMAKLLVEALGYGDLAADSTSSFADAKGTWYEGYVSVAAGLEIVNGYPDGTFKGSATVTYQEAVVMILRALGYNDASVNNGKNAYNATGYKTQASKVGILDGVTFKSAGANRGDVAEMVFNALEVETVEIDENGKATKVVLGQEIEEGTNKIKYIYEILLDRVADKATIKVDKNMIDKDHKSYLGDLVDLSSYMYQEIEVYKNDDGDVVFVKESNDDTYVGTLKANTKENKIDIEINSDKTETADIKATVPVYYNGKEMTNIDEETIEIDLVDAKVVVVMGEDSDGKDYVKGIVATKANYVQKISNEYVSGKSVLDGIKLPVDDSKVDLEEIEVKGAVNSLEDIKEDDVVSLYYPAGQGDKLTAPEKLTIVVTRNTVEGKITKVDDDKLYINSSKQYYEVNTTNGAEEFALSDEGVFYLNEDGKISFLEESESTEAKDYAVLTKLYDGEATTVGRVYDAELKLVNNKGEEIKYAVSTSAKLKLADGTKEDLLNENTQENGDSYYTFSDNLTQDSVVKYSVNSKGEISQIEIIKNIDLASKETQETDDKSFVLASNVLIFNCEDGDYTVVKASELGDEITVASIKYNKNGEVEVLVVNGLGTSDETYAYITKVESVLNDDDDQVQLITAIVDGKEVEYYTTESNTVSTEYVDAGVFVELTFDGEEVQSISPIDSKKVELANNEVTSVSGDRFKVNGEWYTLADDAVIVVLNSDGEYDYVGSVSSLKGSEVELFDTDTDNGTRVVEFVIVK